MNQQEKAQADLITKYQDALNKMANEGLQDELAVIGNEIEQIQSYVRYLNKAYPDFEFHYSLTVSKIWHTIKVPA